MMSLTHTELEIIRAIRAGDVVEHGRRMIQALKFKGAMVDSKAGPFSILTDEAIAAAGAATREAFVVYSPDTGGEIHTDWATLKAAGFTEHDLDNSYVDALEVPTGRLHGLARDVVPHTDPLEDGHGRWYCYIQGRCWQHVIQDGVPAWIEVTRSAPYTTVRQRAGEIEPPALLGREETRP